MNVLLEMRRIFDINNRGQGPGGYPVPDDQVRKNQVRKVRKNKIFRVKSLYARVSLYQKPYAMLSTLAWWYQTKKLISGML